MDKAKSGQLMLDGLDILNEVMTKQKGYIVEGEDGAPSRFGVWMAYMEEQYKMVEGKFRFGDSATPCDWNLWASIKVVHAILGDDKVHEIVAAQEHVAVMMTDLDAKVNEKWGELGCV